MAILVDTGPLVAAADRNDAFHDVVQRFLRVNQEALIAPITVLPEVCYLIATRVGARAETEMVAAFRRGDIVVEGIVPADITRLHVRPNHVPAFAMLP